MRASELFEHRLVEDEAGATDKPVVPSATIIPAHIYDMTGKAYPTDSEGNVPPELFQPVKVQVGLEQGQVSPEQAEQLNNWYATGMKPGGGEDYNKNWFVTDLAYEVIGSADDLAKAITMGSAIQIDGVLKRSATTNLLLSSMGLKTFDDPSKYTTVDVVNSIYDSRDEVFKFFGAEEGFPDFKSWTDQQFKDDQRITAGAVNSWGDLAGLLTGQGWNNIRWQGVVGMIASELPSDILNLAAMSVAATTARAATGGNVFAGGAAAFVANAELSALEAMGFAAFEIDQQVQQLYDDEILQTTDQWKNALEIVGGDEDAAVRYIQKSTYSANVLRTIGGPDVNLTTMQSVGITAGTLDAIVDRLVLGAKIKVPGLKNFAAKATIAGATEAGDEALQQLFINAGLIDKAGAPISTTDGLINAAWQGYIIGKGRSLGADTLRAFGSGAQAIETARAKLRDRLYGVDNDPENFKNVIDILADAPEIGAMSNYLTDDQGQLNLEKLIDENLPTFDSLTRQQRRGKGTIEINGEQMRSSEALKLIRANDYARQYLPTLQNTIYNAVENEYQATFENGTEALRAARLLGFDPDADFDPEENVDQSIEFLEKVLRYDVRVSGRTEFESPNFDTMTGQQRIQFFRDGVVEAGRFKFTREDIVKQSLSDGVGVPENVLSFVQDDPQRVDARPTLDPEIQKLKDRIANSAAMQRAEKALADDQAAWDEEFGDNPDAADFPRPTRDDEDYAELFRQADAIAAPLQSQVNMAESRLKAEQTVWDNKFGDSNNADGGVKVQGPMLNHMFIGYDDAILRKAREQKLQRQEADKEKVTAEQEIQRRIEEKARESNDVASLPPDSSLARANIIYNATMKIAEFDMSVEAAQAMVEDLEKTYPGITKEIFKDLTDESGNPDWDRYDQFQQALNTTNKPKTPQITVLQPGLQRTIDGETFTWQGTETTIGQWRSDTTGRMANKEQQTRLVTQDEADQIPYIDTGSYTPNVEASTYLDNLGGNDTSSEQADIEIDRGTRDPIDTTQPELDDPTKPGDPPVTPDGGTQPQGDFDGPDPIIDPNDPEFAPVDLPTIDRGTRDPVDTTQPELGDPVEPDKKPEVDKTTTKPKIKPVPNTPPPGTTGTSDVEIDRGTRDPVDTDTTEPQKPEVDTTPPVQPAEPETPDSDVEVEPQKPEPQKPELPYTSTITPADPDTKPEVDTEPADDTDQDKDTDDKDTDVEVDPITPDKDTTDQTPDVDTTPPVDPTPTIDPATTTGLVTPNITTKTQNIGTKGKKKISPKVGPDVSQGAKKDTKPPQPYLYKYDRPDIGDPLNLMKFKKVGSPKLSGTGIG